MNKNNILNKLMEITYQPFLIFANQVEEKSDNAFETLRLLEKEENVTAGRIAEYLDIKPSSVTQIIKKLEEAGTANRVKSENDARVTFVELTDKGRESINDQGKISSGLKDEMFKDFTEEELETLDKYLNRINENISSDEFNEKLNEIFGDDKRWKHFSKISAHFGRAREQMLERSGFGNDVHRGFGGGFHGRFGGDSRFFGREHK
ncbi:MarR family winged helix-turn-helix transcriptional regulator [Clostridium sardiniense]|uniref:MarR family winged helix-turn-helix transcriptional regulator n=1 Tax=Clostridium sardiniense TaxID=29369 RepID=UPI003D331664